jgi:hypothetical protein
MVGLDHGPPEIPGTNGAEDADECQDDAGTVARWVLPVARMDDSIDDEEDQSRHVEQHVRQTVRFGRSAGGDANCPVDEPRQRCHCSFEEEGVLMGVALIDRRSERHRCQCRSHPGGRVDRQGG